MKKGVNKLFILLFILVWVSAFVSRLFFAKGEILTFIGLLRTDGFNFFFIIATRFAEEIIYMLFAFIFLFIRYRVSLAIAFTGISVTVVASILKWLFAWERPLSYYKKLGIEEVYQTIEGVEPYIGLNSFPSGHAMAGFALMSLLSLYLRSTILTIAFFIVAVLVAISRVYLGHHFLEDVLFGSAVGIALSYLIYFLIEKWDVPMLDQSFLSSRKVKLNA